MRSRSLLPALSVVALGACALKGDVRRVERQIEEMREETARSDSARAVALAERLDEVITLQETTLDSLVAQRRRLELFQGEVRSDITEVQRQLVQVQELTGQSQQRISELRAQIEERTRTLESETVAAPGENGARGAAFESPGAEELYSIGVQQLRRGSVQTARAAFRKLLEDFPNDRRAPDAQFQIGQTWEGSSLDSAAAAYNVVVEKFPDSPRAPAALYKLGLLAEQRREMDQARLYYNRVIAGYPSSPEAQLARDKLQDLGR